jgi:hypothetical protein
MSNQETRTRQSQPGAGEGNGRTCENAGADLKQTMAKMMARCHCGQDMTTNMTGLMGAGRCPGGSHLLAIRRAFWRSDS